MVQLKDGVIKAIRIELGLSQAELAAILNVSVTTVQNWEYDVFKPTPDTLSNIVKLAKCRGFIYKIEDLYELEMTEEPVAKEEIKKKDGRIFNREVLKNKRKEYGYTQVDVAKKIGVNAYTVSKWERGNIGCSESSVKALAKLFKCKEEEFYL